MAFMTAIAGALAPFANIIGVAGTVATTVGTIQSANAQAAAANYNAQVADRDAVVADQNRKAILQQTQIDVEDKRRENRRVLASMRAAYGNSGLELAGSPLDVLQDTALEQELDVARTDNEGRVRAREGALQMLGLSESANLSRMEARSVRRGGGLGALGVLSSGVGTQLSRVA